jgi:hypothetical protein
MTAQNREEIEVRYDGGDSERHVINALELSESLAGFSRIFATSFHFAATEKFVVKAPAQDFKVYVKAAEPKCYNMIYELWEVAKQQQIFQGVVGNLAVAVVTYVIASAANKKDEMKYLSEALKIALEQNGKRDETVIAKLLATVDRMAESLRPSIRQAVRPIGESCATVRVGGVNGLTLDKEDRAEIDAASPTEVTGERSWKGTLTELDREKATGKVRLEDDMDTRISAHVTDPAFGVTGSIYISAFTTGQVITLHGKAELQDGEIKRLFISHAE